MIREQKRQVSKVLLDGLYDPDCPLSMLLGVRTEIVGEIVWKEMLAWDWQIFYGRERQRTFLLLREGEHNDIFFLVATSFIPFSLFSHSKIFQTKCDPVTATNNAPKLP